MASRSRKLLQLQWKRNADSAPSLLRGFTATSLCPHRNLSSFLSWPDPHSQPPPPPNPPDAENPDPATLREQWRYAIGLYSRWYSHAWGTAILAGLSFFAIGWFVKGENPLPSKENPVEDAQPRQA